MNILFSIKNDLSLSTFCSAEWNQNFLLDAGGSRSATTVLPPRCPTRIVYKDEMKLEQQQKNETHITISQNQLILCISRDCAIMHD